MQSKQRLAESEFPFSYMARSGIHDMLAFGGDKVTKLSENYIELCGIETS